MTEYHVSNIHQDIRTISVACVRAIETGCVCGVGWVTQEGPCLDGCGDQVIYRALSWLGSTTKCSHEKSWDNNFTCVEVYQGYQGY